MANIDRISDVQISLGTAGVEQRSYSKMMLLVTFEAAGRGYVISDPDALLDAPFDLDTTDKGYKAALAAFSQTEGPTDIVIGRIDIDDTSPAQTLAAIAAENDNWYGFADSEHSVLKAQGYAAWGEAHTKLFAYSGEGSTAATTTTTDMGTILKNNNFFRTFGSHLSEPDNFAEVALMAKKFATLPGGESWSNVTLAGVKSARLSDTEISNLEARNMNYFTDYRNLSLSRNGKTFGGEWIDIIRFRDWLQEEIRVNCFNAMIDTRIPFTDGGIAVFGQAIASALDLGVRRGGIVPDYPNAKGNDTIKGYSISLPRAYQVSVSDKRARILRDATFKATLQGAIHATEIRGRLIYDTLPSVG